MAAFENISTLRITPFGRDSDIDLRTTRLDANLSNVLEKYQPRDHRNPKKPLKNWMAYFNLIRTMLGAGMLGTPLAISQTGILLGPLLGILSCLLVYHTHVSLLNTLNLVSAHLSIPYTSYRYGFRLALLHGPRILKPLANCGPQMIATFMVISQFGMCVTFVIFTADSLRDVMDWESNRSAMLVLLCPFVLLEVCMNDMKVISYISLFGTFFNCLGMCFVFVHVFQKPVGIVIPFATEPLPVMFAFGTFLYNLSAVAVILNVDKSLPDPNLMFERFGILRMGLLLPAIFGIFFGVMCYWSFGVMEENILRSMPYDDSKTMLAIGLYMISIGLGHPVQSRPAINIIVDVMKTWGDNGDEDIDDTKVMKFVEILLRPLFVFSVFGVAYTVPFQAPFVAFVGSVCTSMLVLVFPALMDISMMYPGPYGKYNVFLLKNLTIILIGMFAFVWGACLCAYLIYIRYLTMKSNYSQDY